MMRVYLMQHGLAKDKNEDAARPLSDQGRADVQRTTDFLALLEKPQPKNILHSGKLRAEQTADICAKIWGGIEVNEGNELSPNADPILWATRLASMSDDVMLVGHLPHLQRLASVLICGDAQAEAVSLRNGGMLCVQKTGDGWAIQWQINPTLLAAVV